MRGGTVYILTNRPNGTLYLGVTNDLARRVFEHRSLRTPGFTRRYRLTRLVWYENYDDIRDAIQRERTMKHWSRAWKVRLILDVNSNWTDLYEKLAQWPLTLSPPPYRHARPCAGHPTPGHCSHGSEKRTCLPAWMAGTSPAMTRRDGPA